MKKRFYFTLLAVIAIAMVSCNSKPKYIDATYTYKADVNGNPYNMQLTLTKDGSARLQIFDYPTNLYEDGINGYYQYDEECNCYYAYTYEDNGLENVWYMKESLEFVKEIYIGNDGYLYFTTKYFSMGSLDYVTHSALSDVKSQTNRGPQYTQHMN